MDYDYLVSTMPLDQMCRVIKGTSIESLNLPAKAPLFRYSTTHVVGIGLEGQPPPHLKSQCWMYFPEDDCPFYRVTVFSNYSPFNVAEPGRQWSLMAEVRGRASPPTVEHVGITVLCCTSCGDWMPTAND